MSMRFVLFAEGSNDPRWQQPFDKLITKLTKRIGQDRIRLAYLQLIAPTLLEVAEEAITDGKNELLILPFFLAAGAQAAQEIPAQLAAARKKFGKLQIWLLPPIGEQPRVREVLEEVAFDCAKACIDR